MLNTPIFWAFLFQQLSAHRTLGIFPHAHSPHTLYEVVFRTLSAHCVHTRRVCGCAAHNRTNTLLKSNTCQCSDLVCYISFLKTSTAQILTQQNALKQHWLSHQIFSWNHRLWSIVWTKASPILFTNFTNLVKLSTPLRNTDYFVLSKQLYSILANALV